MGLPDHTGSLQVSGGLSFGLLLFGFAPEGQGPLQLLGDVEGVEASLVSHHRLEKTNITELLIISSQILQRVRQDQRDPQEQQVQQDRQDQRVQQGLPCTGSPCWLCSGLPGHVSAGPGSSCRSSRPSGRGAAAARRRGCRAEGRPRGTRSAGRRCLCSETEPVTRRVSVRSGQRPPGGLTTHEQPVFERPPEGSCWSSQGLLDLTSDPGHGPNRRSFELGHLQNRAEHALWGEGGYCQEQRVPQVFPAVTLTKQVFLKIL